MNFRFQLRRFNQSKFIREEIERVQCTPCTGPLRKSEPPKDQWFVLAVGHGLGTGVAVREGVAVEKGVAAGVGVGIRGGNVGVSMRWTFEDGIAID
jgi:hypothetical protein